MSQNLEKTYNPKEIEDKLYQKHVEDGSGDHTYQHIPFPSVQKNDT